MTILGMKRRRSAEAMLSVYQSGISECKELFSGLAAMSLHMYIIAMRRDMIPERLKALELILKKTAEMNKLIIHSACQPDMLIISLI